MHLTAVRFHRLIHRFAKAYVHLPAEIFKHITVEGLR